MRPSGEQVIDCRMRRSARDERGVATCVPWVEAGRRRVGAAFMVERDARSGCGACDAEPTLLLYLRLACVRARSVHDGRGACAEGSKASSCRCERSPIRRVIDCVHATRSRKWYVVVCDYGFTA